VCAHLDGRAPERGSRAREFREKYLRGREIAADREMKMLDKIEQSDQASSPNEKPESCYCSALPEGSGPCLPCYTRWLASRRSKGAIAEEWDWLADQQERTTDLRKKE
jgi:hypothetical protein